MDLILINHTRDFSLYPNCSPASFDMLPTIADVRAYVAGLVGGGVEVRFSQLDSDWSEPVASAGQLDTGTPTLIAGGEESDVQHGIVAKVQKIEFTDEDENLRTGYDCRYLIVRK